jgi:hypothetical protein
MVETLTAQITAAALMEGLAEETEAVVEATEPLFLNFLKRRKP